MEKLIKFDIESIEKLMNEDKKENKGKVESMKDPALFYINQEIKLGDISKYEVTAKIGRGRYSEVFSGTSKHNNEKIVVKILRPINKNKIKREVVILKYLNECPNSVHLLDITKGESIDIYCLIYNNISGHDLKLVYKNITPEDMKLYIYKILQCLSFCHSKKIMHRDIKSGNIVVNTLTKELNVIDWGLSEYYISNYKYNTRVGTRFYKAPELLLDYKKYDYAIDVWSAGCVLASLLFQKDFFFKGSDLNNQIIKIAEVFGYKEFEKFYNKYQNDIRINKKVMEQIKNFEKKEWKSFVNENNKYLVNDDVIDLLDKMLKFDPLERIKAKDAINHPYFKEFFSDNEDEKE
jgi:casein kinase II subunit alpha